MGISSKDVFNNYLLVDACILYDMTIVVAALSHPAHRDGVFISQILFLTEEEWVKGPYFGWEVVSITTAPFDKDSVIILGRNGDCFIAKANLSTEISLPEHQPPNGPYRQVQHINESVYLVGEERSVWRLDEKSWILLSEGMPTPSEYDSAIDNGSEDRFIDQLIEESEVMFGLAGYDSSNLCLVGTGGEIWAWNGARWSREDLGTNMNFYDVCRAENSTYIACGQAGNIYQGGQHKWALITPNEVHNDFCSVAKFAKKIYLADGNGLFHINDNAIERVSFNLGIEVPSHLVISNDQLIVSLAAKELFLSADGITWKSAIL
jgi:hypothetical protein